MHIFFDNYVLDVLMRDLTAQIPSFVCFLFENRMQRGPALASLLYTFTNTGIALAWLVFL